jgi:hypothetical protein
MAGNCAKSKTIGAAAELPLEEKLATISVGNNGAARED